jgi:uncharacterized protein
MWVAHLALAVILGSGCQRASQEDFVRSRAGASVPVVGIDAARGDPVALETATHPVDPSPAGRCIKLTPSQAPPPVAPGPPADCPPDPEATPVKLPQVRVGFAGVGGVGDVVVDAELVRSEHDMARGLMFRRVLAQDRGMLFDLRTRIDHKFWMHNTCIPLDLLFIDGDGLVVGIVENAPTLDDTSRGVGCPSRWVLEVNAGWARRHGVRAGHYARLPP